MYTKLIKVGAFALFTLICINLNATHLIGGEITWECHPTNGQYRINARLYRDCSSSTAALPPQSMLISLSNGSPDIVASLIANYQVTPSCYDPSASYACGLGSGVYDAYLYRSAWVTINNIPATGLELFWGSCCRPSAVTNLAGSSLGFGLRSIMYPGAGSSACNNNPPRFLEQPLVRACSGEQLTYNPIAMDLENDSIFVKLASPVNDLGLNATYDTGYSALSPFPGTSQNSSNTPLTINSANGAMSFKSYTQGLFISVLEIEEWRQGALLSRTFRDAPTFINSCTPNAGLCPQSGNSIPIVTMYTDSTLFPNGPFVVPTSLTGVKEYEVKARVGDTINAIVNALDFDFYPNCSPQQIGFNAAGVQLSSALTYNDPNACNGSAPCATINSLNSGGGFINTLSNQVAFNWVISPAHLTYQGIVANSTSHTFSFTESDGACPIPGSAYASLKVVIEDNIPAPPSLSKSCVNIVASTGDISFNANSSVDTADSFYGYFVYHSSNKMGPYTIIDTISNYALSGYTDIGRGPGNSFYFMRTASTMLSPTSDTLALMTLNLATSQNQVSMNWNAHSTNQNQNTYYQIWRQDSLGAPLILIDSTQATSYLDTPSVVAFGLDYKIAIGGTCFSQKTGTIGIDELILDNIQVSPVPFNTEVNITLPDELDAYDLEIELFNTAGQRISFENEIGESAIKLIGLDALPNGIYYLHLFSNGKTRIIKLVH